MKDDLRKRGFGVLGKLIKTKSAEALPDERAWKREFITAFPQDEPLGVLTAEEADWSELETRKMDPDFTLADRSTMLVEDDSLAATVFTHAVRLHRLQPPSLKAKSKAGRKPIPDDDILDAVKIIVSGQSTPNYNKALIAVLNDRGLEPEELETVYERVKKKMYPLGKIILPN